MHNEILYEFCLKIFKERYWCNLIILRSNGNSKENFKGYWMKNYIKWFEFDRTRRVRLCERILKIWKTFV